MNNVSFVAPTYLRLRLKFDVDTSGSMTLKWFVFPLAKLLPLISFLIAFSELALDCE